ncbi:AraC family transcriptional regulator [Saccharibacillus brassicae]|uniref:Helix-turn-helix transcriptional regulator n=1 Tax=Saccharibacillus brassicae TaxID=2583377 RepID=A0A4Y6V2S6_SACBS|nr:AraC family transcriptional regulator [Saccharibacillus brassicae]QDH23070.1 helix-turn-helix transcriptional regulator [Saccharibacillus brassicae]
MNTMDSEHYEITQFEEIDFPFHCFQISNLQTLPHWHNHTEIIYVRQGECTVYIDGIARIGHEGDLMLVPKGSLHSVLPRLPAEYLALVIGDTLFTSMLRDVHCEAALGSSLLNGSLAPLHMTPAHAAYPELSNLIKNIIQEGTQKKEGYQLSIKVSLCQFCIFLMRHFPNSVKVIFDSRLQGAHVLLIKQALEYLALHYTEKVTIADMSLHVNLSGQHFCRLFKSYTGKTFTYYLTDLRLDHANRLLLTTDLPITRIPELTGFCNANYFSRIFKKRYGHVPSHVRKKLTPGTVKQAEPIRGVQ